MAGKPYKGEENYIFVSYSHRNQNEVLPFIETLQNSGYNVWYDEGIDPGTEWDDNIASHIEGCSSFIAYVTNEYIASQNCRDEMSFARDLDKDRLLIYAEEVVLPRGMQMRLNRWQAIYKHKYDKQSDFYNKVFESNAIKTCKSDYQDKSSLIETITEPKVETEPSASNNKKKILVIIGAIVCMAIIAVLIAVTSSGDKDADSASRVDASASSSSEVVGDVSDSTSQTETDTNIVGGSKDEEDITINKSNAHSTLYNDNNVTITLDGMSYVQGASGADIAFDIDNGSKELLWLAQDNTILIDGATLSPEFENGFDEADAWEANSNGYSIYSVTREDIEAAGVEDFKEMTTTFYIRLGEKDLATKTLHISRDAFSED